ncbi:hypothetical protein [Polluticoccus soli]|uniref:hypothetical protein n=1 Tax=Polluticoccus soli TaxID=3034150 RepID=UPI0023E2B664|nr:hypothetical protein [Flavipsychrobacter sp. JY13-12]
MPERKAFRYITFLLLLWCDFGQLTAQEYILVGSLTVDGAGSYTYKLQFKDSAGTIKGFSITDIGGKNQTRSAVTGSINESKKELVFREVNISNTKSTAARDSFCFVHARLKLAGMKKGKALKGRFTGYRSGGKSQCAKGSIVLYSATDVLDKLMKQNPTADSLLKPLKARLREPDTSQTNATTVNSGSSFETTYTSSTATLELWDDQHIDGDIVSVLHNRQTILSRHSLASTRKQLTFQLTGKTDTIALVAISEGSEPSNTAMLKLTTGSSIHYLKASSKLNTPTYIILRAKGSN